MSHKAYKFWNPEVGKTYHLRIIGESPNYGQHWIKTDEMTPEQRRAKRLIDAVSGSAENVSWLDIRDTRYPNSKRYTMPGTSLPAYRYSYITGKGRSRTEEMAQAFEQKARDAGYPIRAYAHETHSMDGRSVYWKVATFIPIHSFRDK